jgi:A/G-specific adenine glycosylase
MPWKGEKDPYRIWLSEIILQQTRVEQGRAYYEKFLHTFPTITHLATAPEQQVFKLWEGLGYYNRCRNLIATAKKIVTDYNGQFPNTFEEILALKGIGPYTAAAIASFAFNLPHAVVDGNVIRILARYFNDSTPADTAPGKKRYSRQADLLLDKNQPGIYNQAIMDFGALICKPQQPLCHSCIQRLGCKARQFDRVADLPVKAQRLARRQRWFYYFLLETPDGKIYIRKRTGKDIWEDLYELVLWETDKPADAGEILHSDFARLNFGEEALTVRHISRMYRQELSHQIIQGQFITVRLDGPVPKLPQYQLVDRKSLSGYAFPKFINAWLYDPTPLQSLF